ncbi:MAG: homoserine kinase [Pseudorhodoplanes sp.]
MAVYTDVPVEELDAFLEGYDIGKLLSYKGIAEGVQNSNFLLHTDAGYFILTLYERLVAVEDIPFFISLMEHLAQSGINCPQPVHRRDGKTLGNLCGRAAAIVNFLDGVWMRRVEARHCAAVGDVLARLHLAGADFAGRRANALAVTKLRPLFDSCADRIDGIQPGMKAAIDEELDFLEGAWPRGLPEGVIHADLFPDNVFFLGEKLSGLIDFYFACNDMLAYDVAICLNAWCFENDHSYNVTKGRALLQAYAKVRPMTDAELAAMPTLARGAALRFLATRVVDWLNVPPGALVRPKAPQEYFRKLRFHQKAKSVHDYGVEARELA